MAARQIFRIRWQKGKWLVMKDRGILGTFRGRKTAENLAREKADLGWSSQLLIYRPNGSIETSLFIPKITGSEPQMRS